MKGIALALFLVASPLMASPADTLSVRLHLLGLSVAVMNAVEMGRISEEDQVIVAHIIKSAQENLYQAHANRDRALLWKVEKQIRTASDYLLRIGAVDVCVCPAEVSRLMEKAE